MSRCCHVMYCSLVLLLPYAIYAYEFPETTEGVQSDLSVYGLEFWGKQNLNSDPCAYRICSLDLNAATNEKVAKIKSITIKRYDVGNRREYTLASVSADAPEGEGVKRERMRVSWGDQKASAEYVTESSESYRNYLCRHDVVRCLVEVELKDGVEGEEKIVVGMTKFKKVRGSLAFDTPITG